MSPAIPYALLAAALFGASTPIAKHLVGGTSPILLAGLLYLGSGLGLALFRLLRDRGWRAPHMPSPEWRWFAAAILFGGIAAPIALMVGLTHTSGATASLLLNLEAVLTALIAWVAFRENACRRVVLGMVLIATGGLALSWPHAGAGWSGWGGPLAVALACLAWAVDNNLTRKVSASDAVFIAASRGIIAGGVNCALALSLGAALPPVEIAGAMMAVGLLGYGVSLVLFVLALRGLGAARTGAYFATAPFIGAAVAVTLLDEPTGMAFWLAAALMGAGVWLHLTERHEHEHRHEPMAHRHSHTHDGHHQHAHPNGWDGAEPHDHWHTHAAVVHKHPHFPDIHHRHSH